MPHSSPCPAVPSAFPPKWSLEYQHGKRSSTLDFSLWNEAGKIIHCSTRRRVIDGLIGPLERRLNEAGRKR